MRIVGWSKVTKHRRSRKLGARAFVVPTNAHGWDARYEIDTHGLSPAQVADKLAKLEVRHEKWARRISGFGALLDVEVVVEGEIYRIADCTIPAGRPFDDAELIVGIRHVTQTGELQRVPGWPIRLRFNSIDDVWPDARIIQEVRNRLQTSREERAADNAYKSRLNALMTE